MDNKNPVKVNTLTGFFYNRVNQSDPPKLFNESITTAQSFFTC